MTREAVLVSNGPGELYTWTLPVLRELRLRDPTLKISISLIPCQFASGHEVDIARGFGADAVTTPSQYLRAAAGTGTPPGLGADRGFVLSLGGNAGMALTLARGLGYPTYRYSFVPYWHRRLRRLFVHDERAARRARRLGAPAGRLEIVGNLVADAIEQSGRVDAAGQPHILLLAGSRDAFAIHLIPFMIALADELGRRYPRARFVWPVSRLLERATIERGVAGEERATLGGMPGRLEPGRVITPGGTVLEMVDESARYAHFRSADLAITIPGTNTLELGIAGVPAVVLLPLNRPEAIPLEGPGHWLSLIPIVGTPLKRAAVRLFVERMDYPVSLPNHFTGEDLMVEISGEISLAQVTERVAALLDEPADLARRRDRLRATMPAAGASARLVERLLDDLDDGG